MGRRLALVIGNSAYEDSGLARLAAPDADVIALAEVLRDSSIGAFQDVQPLVNESFARTRRAIARFFDGRRSDDLLLLYFSGHGIRDAQGCLHLAVRDTERELLSATAIESSFITGCMDRCVSKRLVLILDCCHSGAFGYGAKSAERASVGTAVAFEGNGRGRIVLTATDSTQYAWEGETAVGTSQPSVFTRHLTAGLRSGAADRDRDGLVTIDELYEYIYDQVLNETAKQTPGKWAFGQQGDLVIARSPAADASGAPLPVRPATVPAASDYPLHRFSAVRTFLARHPLPVTSGAAAMLVLLTMSYATFRQPSPEPAASSMRTDIALQAPPEQLTPAVPPNAGKRPEPEITSEATRGSGSARTPPGRPVEPQASNAKPATTRAEDAMRTDTPDTITATQERRDDAPRPPRHPISSPPERTSPALTSSEPASTPPVEPAASRAPTKPAPEAQVKEALAEYQRAAEARDLDALRNVWPGAPESLRRSYASMRSQSVDLRSCTAPVFDGDMATVVCQERVSVVGVGGISPPPATSTATFSLRLRGDSWQIAEIRRQRSS